MDYLEMKTSTEDLPLYFWDYIREVKSSYPQICECVYEISTLYSWDYILGVL